MQEKQLEKQWCKTWFLPSRSLQPDLGGNSNIQTYRKQFQGNNYMPNFCKLTNFRTRHAKGWQGETVYTNQKEPKIGSKI